MNSGLLKREINDWLVVWNMLPLPPSENIFEMVVNFVFYLSSPYPLSCKIKSWVAKLLVALKSNLEILSERGIGKTKLVSQ